MGHQARTDPSARIQQAEEDDAATYNRFAGAFHDQILSYREANKKLPGVAEIQQIRANLFMDLDLTTPGILWGSYDRLHGFDFQNPALPGDESKVTAPNMPVQARTRLQSSFRNMYSPDPKEPELQQL